MSAPLQPPIFEHLIDPQLRESLREKPNLLDGNPTLYEVQARLNSSFQNSDRNVEYASKVTIDELHIPAKKINQQLSIRCYTPKALEHKDPLPVLLWIHGGGFIAGDAQSDDPICERFSIECGCIVVSVDYRLAPQHPFPAGFDDCYAALQWLEGSGKEKLNADVNNLIVGGASAGGCLAAGVVLKATEAGGPKIKHQLLIVPALDDRHQTVSSKGITDYRYGWNRELSQLAWEGYLKNLSGDTPVYAVPARATKIPNLPSTFISVEDQDLLRDEAIIYAQRLMQANVVTELHVYPGTFHGSFLETPDAEISKQHMSDVLNSLRRSFIKYGEKAETSQLPLEQQGVPNN